MKASGVHHCANLGKLGELCKQVFKGDLPVKSSADALFALLGFS
jgi:hypothetical protein